MNRFLLTIVVLSLPALRASGQNPMMQMAPIRVLADVDAALEHSAVAFSVGIDGVTPLEYFLPNVSPGSRLELMGLGVGARVHDGEAGFRWRVMPLTIDIAKPPWIAGVTVLRYDRTGIRTVEADWIATHGGPAGQFNVGRIGFGPAVVLRAALATRRTGLVFFPDLGPEAEDGATGAATEIAARLVAWTEGGARLTIQASVERLWAGQDPELRSLGATLRIPLGQRLVLIGRSALVEGRAGGHTSRVTVLGAGLRINLQSGRSV